ncbi:5-formyltetrahydrofolate cyclo-ligase [Euwallacea similis]|uniref:5-formyltetrahydrofolate cyclo-ligase n=1 Tax=Euwallacea similis TaxID=1736056 RepID=UPI00344B5426
MAAIEASKTALRQEIALRIAKLTVEEKQRQSKIVFEKLINLSAFKSSNRISIYLSTADEIDTELIVRKIFEDGKKCFIPRYSKAGMQMVRLASIEDWETLPLTKWNIKQPLLKEKREDAVETGGLDLLVCPGVAFTPQGNRLGHGGGYYDSYLNKLKQLQEFPPAAVAVAFKEQVQDSIPVTPNDVTVDAVLYPK